MAPKKRNRDAGTGRIVSAADAKARPKETVSEAIAPAKKPEPVEQEAPDNSARIAALRAAVMAGDGNAAKELSALEDK